MRQALFITLLAVMVYAGISTIIADAGIIGSIGEIIAKANRALFGYVAFVYLFALLYPLYRYYRSSEIDVERTEKILAVILLFFSILILQALVVTDVLRGALGAGFVDFLHPYIGTFGLWVFWVMTIAIAAVILIDAEKFPSMPASKISFMHRSNSAAAEQYTNNAMDEIGSAVRSDKADDDPFDAPAYARRNTLQETDDTKIKIVSKPTQERVEPEPDEAPFDLAVEAPVKKSTIVKVADDVKKKKSAVIVNELDENKKLLEQIEKGKAEKPKNFKLPSLDFLQKPPKQGNSIDERELDDKIRDLIEKLSQFKIEGDVIRTYAGPVVSTFEFKPAAHIKVSKILNLQDDLAMALRAETIR
ncbi:MAG TPA: DNA translocase FtsK, partial [Sulfuricurvum sp.]|nr:DNA translocase FtsK [Sulfuricurvum sp.]